MALLRDLYPAIEPYVSGRLAVDEIHSLYWEECGNPNGIPVVFLHGGGGFNPRQPFVAPLSGMRRFVALS